MTLAFALVVIVAGVATAAAAGLSMADGALLALDEDEPPNAPAVRELLSRRERAHRALAYGRILSQLLAGATVAVALKVSGLSPSEWSVVAILTGVVAVVVAESAARTAGDALGATALERLGPLIAGVESVLSPVVAFGGWCDSMLVRVIPPAPPDDEDREETIEQFRQVVAAEADVTRDEAVLLKGVFSLGDTAVQEVMVPRVDIVGIEKDSSWSEVVDRVRSVRHARLVVFDGTLDEVIGILYAKDLLPAFVADSEPAGGWLALVKPATFIPGTKTVEAQMRDFRATHRHIAIVVDEYGGTAGLVTLEDALELIVGEIRDENDIEEPDVVREDGDKFWISARVSLDELSELTGEDFTREDVQTVGGLVYELTGRVPKAGETMMAGHFRVVVERVVRRRVERVYFERLEAAGEGAA